MSRRFIIALIGITLICAYVGCDSNAFSNNINKTLMARDKLQEKDFQIGNLYLLQPISEVIKILGKPLKVNLIPNKDGVRQFDEEEYYFNGLIVRTFKSDQKVTQFQIKDQRFSTYRGVKIGDRLEDIYLHYGKQKPINDAVSYWVTISSKELTYKVIGFHIKNKTIKQIDIAYVVGE